MPRGELDEAEAAFRRAVDGGAPDRLTAEVNLAELLFRTGRVDEAMARFDRFIDIYNDADGRLSAPGPGGRRPRGAASGRRDPDLFQDALRAFDEAAAADPDWAEPHAARRRPLPGEVPEPRGPGRSSQEVLARESPTTPGRLLGMARALEFDGTPGARGARRGGAGGEPRQRRRPCPPGAAAASRGRATTRPRTRPRRRSR